MNNLRIYNHVVGDAEVIFYVSHRDPLSNLWWELQQARKQIESASVGHADDDVSDASVGRMVEKLIEKAHHALCSFSSITLHSCKLGGEEVVKFLQIMRKKIKR